MKLFLLTIVLGLAASPTNTAHGSQEDDVIVKRYKQVLHAYIGRLKAKNALSEIISSTADELDLSEEIADALIEQVPATLTKFVQETAESWRTDENRRRVESRSLNESLLLVEESDAWQNVLKAKLDEQQLVAWQEGMLKRNADAIQVRKRAQEAAERAAAAKRLAVQRRAIAMAEAFVANPGRLDQIPEAKETLGKASRGAIDRSRSSAAEELQEEAGWLTKALDLTPKQTRRMEVAIKGVLKKQFGSALVRVGILEKEAGEEEAERVRAELLEIYLKYRAPKSLIEDKFWLRAVKSTLTDEQFAQYRQEQTARSTFRRETQVRMIVMTLDRAARLTIAQREQLSTKLSQFDGDLACSQNIAANRLFGSMNEKLQELVGSMLSESQMEQVQRLPVEVRRRAVIP